MLLTFDTASPTVSVALLEEGVVVAEGASAEAMRHGEQLRPLIDRVLAEAGAIDRDVTAVGVGAGPGPFTGLRVGLVTARVLGLILDVPVYAVCSLDALAVEAVATGVVDAPFLVATDARRREVYWASYDGEGRRVDAPAVGRPASVASSFAGGVPVIGEGATLYPEAFPGGRGPQRPSAAWLGRAISEELVELLDPDPLYLRRPDAEVPGPPKQAPPEQVR